MLRNIKIREIKFRAWDKISQWFIENYQINYGVMTNPSKAELKENRFIYMQYTGLKDKNGKEIYEGDIISPGIGEIFWNDKRNGWVVRWHNKTWKRVRGNSQEYRMIGGENLFSNSHIVWEVIGNIYKNPLLLGDKDEK